MYRVLEVACDLLEAFVDVAVVRDDLRYVMAQRCGLGEVCIGSWNEWATLCRPQYVNTNWIRRRPNS